MPANIFQTMAGIMELFKIIRIIPRSPANIFQTTAGNLGKNNGSSKKEPSVFKCKSIYAVTILLAFSSEWRSTASSLILYLRILPAAFIGKPSTKSTYLGTLCLAM